MLRLAGCTEDTLIKESTHRVRRFGNLFARLRKRSIIPKQREGGTNVYLICALVTHSFQWNDSRHLSGSTGAGHRERRAIPLVWLTQRAQRRTFETKSGTGPYALP